MKKRVSGNFAFAHVAYLLAAAIVLLAFAFNFSEQRSPLASAETQFIEMSESGLSIVPASCASGSNAANCSCRLTLSRKVVGGNESVTLSWSSSAGGVLAPFNQRVGASGTKTFPSPGVTTTYRLSGSTSQRIGGKDGSTHTSSYSCSATLNYCQEKTYCDGNELWSQRVVADGCVPAKVRDCPNGCVNGACLDEGALCPTGYVRVNNECIYAGCPSGYIRNQEGWCEAAQQCTTNSDCGAGFICSGNRCLYDFVPGSNGESSGDISATPSLVRSGKTSLIKWQSVGYDECEVTENNPDIHDGGEGWSGTNGEHQTSPIGRRTQYTLTCDGEVADTVSVNILPVFIEI